ncbi:hypothetical protein G7046_g945 [Stylonectria norvegica]|nr:hypothetical protein G7046_g945 [Stylonectria norvegica]
MKYCASCGIQFTRNLQESWLQEFRAVWITDDAWDNVKLTGVGLCGEYHDDVTGTAPSDPSKHYNDSLDPNSMIDVSLTKSNLRYVWRPETARLAIEPFWGWAFHSSCWSIFTVKFTPNLRLVFELCLSTPTGLSSFLNWGHQYGGAAVLDEGSETPRLISRFPQVSSLPPNLKSDPFNIPSLRNAIERSTRLQNNSFGSSLDLDNLSLDGDIFSRLSPELLQFIVTLLPTPHVHALRLASPVFATLGLSEQFWASRFQEGHEFDHITEVLETPPESWRAMYLSLCIWAADNPSMANRRRTWGLAKTMRRTLQQMEGVSCQGEHLDTLFEPSTQSEPHLSASNVSWLTAARSISAEDESFQYGCRILRSRAVYFSVPPQVQQILVSFVDTGGGPFVSGIQLVDLHDRKYDLGYVHPDNITVIRLSCAHCIQGFELALDWTGIRAIAVVDEDGTTSSWAGAPRDFPRWRLAEVKGLLAVKAEFDALKMVSLSRDISSELVGTTEWRNNCLWQPSVPPEHLIFNSSQGSQPPEEFNVPVTTLFFGGSDGRDLKQLVEIVVCTFDSSFIAGLAFVYADGSLNRQLGHISSFGAHQHPVEQLNDPEYSRISMPIDGPRGEEVTIIEAQDCYAATDCTYDLSRRFTQISAANAKPPNIIYQPTEHGLLSNQQDRKSSVSSLHTPPAKCSDDPVPLSSAVMVSAAGSSSFAMMVSDPGPPAKCSDNPGPSSSTEIGSSSTGLCTATPGPTQDLRPNAQTIRALHQPTEERWPPGQLFLAMAGDCLLSSFSCLCFFAALGLWKSGYLIVAFANLHTDISRAIGFVDSSSLAWWLGSFCEQSASDSSMSASKLLKQRPTRPVLSSWGL